MRPNEIKRKWSISNTSEQLPGRRRVHRGPWIGARLSGGWISQIPAESSFSVAILGARGALGVEKRIPFIVTLIHNCHNIQNRLCRNFYTPWLSFRYVHTHATLQQLSLQPPTQLLADPLTILNGQEISPQNRKLKKRPWKDWPNVKWQKIPRIPGVEGVVGLEPPQTDPPLAAPPQTLESPDAVDGNRPLPQVSLDCCRNKWQNRVIGKIVSSAWITLQSLRVGRCGCKFRIDFHDFRRS